MEKVSPQLWPFWMSKINLPELFAVHTVITFDFVNFACHRILARPKVNHLEVILELLLGLTRARK